MKKELLCTLAIVALCVAFSSCKPQNPVETPPTDPIERTITEDGDLVAADNLLWGDTIGNGDDEFVFTGKQTLKKGTYLLHGWVYIRDGAELTIEPGTVVKGIKGTKAALIVERGGKLYAQGTKDAPIVFTSAQPKGERCPGDWGGLIICGKAKNNQTEMQIEGGPRTKHGGNDDADNSGVLSYVRVEFAGYPFQTDKEINGITFGSVGNGTQVDHVQVSYSNDDSYEWFGGSVNCKYLIAYRGWDDDFDTDNGFSGNVQYGLAWRDSRIADISQSNGFESDNCADGASVSPYTSCVFSNITFVGPRVDANFVNDASYINAGEVNPNNGSSLGKFQAAMHIRRNSHLNCFNSLILGWPIAIIIDNEKGNSQAAATDGTLELNHIWAANYEILGSDMNKLYKDELVTDYKNKTTDDSQKSFSHTWFLTSTYANAEKTAEDLALDASKHYMPSDHSSVLNAAEFSSAKLVGMEPVSFIGAFGSDDWTEGWTNFDPENTDY